MPASAGYYRYPTVHRDRVVFVSEDDLWEVARTGGTAHRLTVGLAEATRPRFSPDGQHLAFVGKEAGDQEVYVMPSLGGPVRRLTFLGANVSVQGWQDNHTIIFATNAHRPFRAWYELWTVDLDGHSPKPLNLGPANAIALGPHGAKVIGRNIQDPARWKRYRGGTHGYLWIDATGSGQYQRFDGLDGNSAAPMWIGEAIYFISDAQGVANLYTMHPDGQGLHRLTNHQDYYVRNASADDRYIVYHRGGNLYCYDTVEVREALIPVTYGSPFTQRERLFPNFSRYWTDYAASGDDAESLILAARGKLFQLRAFDGPVVPLGVTQGVRYRLPTWLPDGDRILTVSDEGGEEALTCLHVRGNDAPRRLPTDLGMITALKVSGDGKYAAVANHRLELWLVDLENFRADRVDQSEYGQILGFDFSPDSQFLAYSIPLGPQQASICIYAIEEKTVHAVTSAEMTDLRPVFDPAGQYLYFLSYRVFNPVYDNLRFDLGFPKGMRPFLVTLTNQTPSPFLVPDSVATKLEHPESNPEGETDDDLAEDQNEETAPTSTPVPMTIDFEGIGQRVLALPVAEGRYLQIEALPGRILYTTREPEGSLDQSLFSGPARSTAVLKMYDLKTQKEEVLASGISNFRLFAGGSKVLIRSRHTLRIAKAGEKVDDKKREPGRESGLVDLGRISLAVDRQAEWGQMLREAWRLMRENFWTEDMSGVDWEAVYLRYQALLPRIATRGEFSDLMWEMQGELGTSHAYEMGGDYRPEPAHRMGHLAMTAEYDLEANGFRILSVATGDSWQPEQDSPLNAPGVGLKPGDVIRAVNRQPVGPDRPPEALLVDLADQPVELSIIPQGTSTVKNVTVKTLPQAFSVYYRQWVNQNRSYVHQQSQGRVGYVHIPDMGPRGYAEFFRGYLEEDRRDGLIVDVRYNGGGHVSQLILEHLARRRLGYDIPRRGKPIPYPSDSMLGPIVALTNEHAGSDGDIFSHAFQMMKLGPLIGTRTWGGVIGINPRTSLVDGSVVTQPEYAYWFQDVGFGVENYGTDPDIWVDITPMDAEQGRDPQLDRALSEVLDRLQREQPAVPDFGPRPSRRPPEISPPS
jgi:tricorn protease